MTAPPAGPVPLDVPEENHESRLDVFLAATLSTFSLGAVRRMLARGCVTLNGSRSGRDRVVRLGDAVVIDAPDEGIDLYAPLEMDLDVLYEDARVIVINKPAGLPVLPDPRHAEADAVSGLMHYFAHVSPLRDEARERRPYLIHRPSIDTSGVLLVARDADAARDLAAQFERQSVRKEYLAVVMGEPPAEAGVIDRPIARRRDDPSLMCVDEERGVPSVTDYAVAESFNGYTLLRVEPKTGRTDQIRAHLSAVGLPLVIDADYGGGEAAYLSAFKRRYRPKADRPEPPLMQRLSLHAHRLSFTSPAGPEVHAEAPLPKDFGVVLKMLRKYRPERSETF